MTGQVPESGRGYWAQDWPLAGGDWTSSRYSTLTDISTDTVDRLGGAASRATPVVKDGVIYLYSCKARRRVGTSHSPPSSISDP